MSKVHLPPAKQREAVDTCLQAAFRGKINAASKVDEQYHTFWQAIAELVMRGGKRLRPQLVFLTYAAYGGTDIKAITPVAASQELFHAFMLMHDDVIDRDTTRWGGPNISGTFLPIFLENHPPTDARHYADSWAIMAGDACSGLSNELLLNSHFPAELIVKAAQLVQSTLQAVIGGELLDVNLAMHNHEFPSEHQLLTVCQYKTASYSFVTPLQLGALLAGADKHILTQLEKIGVNMGIAFQLRDDLIGMFSDQAVSGKSDLSDLREGKQTLLILEAYKHADSAMKKRLDGLLGKADATIKDLEDMRQLLKETGALVAVEKSCLGYAQKARKAIGASSMDAASQQQLIELVDFISHRDY